MIKQFFGRNLNLIIRRPQLLRMSTNASDEVLFESIKDVGVITLNRPKVLNSLNLNMINLLSTQLQKWENEKKLVIIKGAGGKAFCAGGDVKSVAIAGLQGDHDVGKNFFKTEYVLNGFIGSYKIPYIALIDGIVMGGGVGVSAHGRYRIATEKTMFAFPETQIGLVPDVGGSYILSRLDGKLGLYLALTGNRLLGADVFKTGIATHYCKSENLGALEKDLLECTDDDTIKKTLQKHCIEDKSELSFAKHIKQINDCFSGKTIEDIIARLEKDSSEWSSEWATEQILLLAKMSPTSLKVTLKELEFGSKLSLRKCLQMEYRLVVNCLHNKEFYEGVRALLIDKDQKPNWNPKYLKDVTDSYVDSYFGKLAETQELKHKL